MEGRAVLAIYDVLSQSFTIWSATQAPHGIKRAVAEMFGMAENHVRVIAPDVGGGFGPKVLTYPEEIVIPYCAKLLGRPVKWTEDRHEQDRKSGVEVKSVVVGGYGYIVLVEMRYCG